MKAGIRTYKSAHLEISVPQAIPEHLRGRIRELTSFHVEPEDRHQGLGTKLLESTCTEADQEQMALLIQVQPFDVDGYVDVEQLQAFYGQFGFVAIQQEPAILMVRTPVKTNFIVRDAISRALH